MLAEPIDLRPLGWARATFGLVFLLRTTPVLALLDVPFTRTMGPLLGWPEGGARLPVVGWSLPSAVVAALCIVRTAAALALTVGVRTRIAGVTAGLAGWLLILDDQAGYLHHLNLLYTGAILLGLTDASARFAIAPTPPRAPASSLLLLRVWVASIYAWACIGKLRADWLDGSALEALFRQGALAGPLADVLIGSEPRRIVVAFGVVVVEALMPILLLWRKTRRAGLVAALLLHIGFEVVGRIDSIGWQMMALLLVFLEPQRQKAAAAGHTISD